MVTGYFLNNQTPIPPDNGNGNNNNTTGEYIDITAPIDKYVIPDRNNYHHVHVIMETNDIKGKHKVQLAWHGDLSYSMRVFEVDGEQTFSENMVLGRMSPGSHSLSAKLFKPDGTMIDEDIIHVIVPDYYIYTWDYRDVSICPECVYRGSEYDGLYKYGFTFPYMQDGIRYFLRGEILKVYGMLDVAPWVYCECVGDPEGHLLYCNQEIYLYSWNTEIDEWVTIDKTTIKADVCDQNCSENCGEYINEPTEASFIIDVNNVWGNEIAFFGKYHDRIDGFIGELWVQPGTWYYQMSPFQQFLSWFKSDGQPDPIIPSI